MLSARPKVSRLFVWYFMLAFGTDIVDGALARHYHSGSVVVNVFDGIADVCLYTASLLYLKKFYMDIIQPYYSKLKLLVFFQLVAWCICLVRFGHISSWHTYMAKFFGLSIAATIGAITIFRKSVFLPLLLIIGAVYLIDDIAITLVMPYWRTSVMSVFDAIGYRNKFNARKHH